MASDSSIPASGWHIDDARIYDDTEPTWVPLASTAPGVSRIPWTVPLGAGDDYCLSIVGKAPGYSDSPVILSGPFSIASGDTDGDGSPDVYELTVLGTSPNKVDTDGDGLVDGSGGVVSLADLPGGIDEDSDGFVDGETDLGTDPTFSNVGRRGSEGRSQQRHRRGRTDRTFPSCNLRYPTDSTRGRTG
jgi:hypothetical protein